MRGNLCGGFFYSPDPVQMTYGTIRVQKSFQGRWKNDILEAENRREKKNMTTRQNILGLVTGIKTEEKAKACESALLNYIGTDAYEGSEADLIRDQAVYELSRIDDPAVLKKLLAVISEASDAEEEDLVI